MKIRKNKTINQTWVMWLDKLWRIIIHNRDGSVCQWCGTEDSSKVYNAHHIFGRSNKSVRWYTPNGLKLCYYCHQHRKEQDPEGLRSRIIVKMGLKAYKNLYKKAITPLPFIDYLAWERSLLKELETLEVTIPPRPKRLPLVPFYMEDE